jgi:hypothetical protein
MTPKWAKSSSSSLPSPQPLAQGNPLAMRPWSYPIGVLGLYIMFNLIKSQFSNFPWHRIWPYSKKIRMKSPCSNPHVPMFRVILDDFSYHITSYNRSLWRGRGDLVCIRISLVAHSR